MSQKRGPDTGITLIEMLVALMIFALVGLASFTTLDTILRVRAQTDGRLEHLAQLDRGLKVFGLDMTQSDPMAIVLEDQILTTLFADGRTQRRYQLRSQMLVRESGEKNTDDPLAQSLINDVSSLQFRVLDTEKKWQENWPDPKQSTHALAVEMIITLEADETLRRLVPLSQPVLK